MNACKILSEKFKLGIKCTHRIIREEKEPSIKIDDTIYYVCPTIHKRLLEKVFLEEEAI